MRWLVSQVVWISKYRLPFVALLASAVWIALSSIFWLTAVTLIEESIKLFESPTLENTLHLTFFYAPIAFASGKLEYLHQKSIEKSNTKTGCYFIAYLLFLRLVLLTAVRYVYGVLNWITNTASVFLGLIIVSWLVYGKSTPFFEWTIKQSCACAKEYVEFEDYQKMLAMMPLPADADQALRRLNAICEMPQSP